MLVTMSKAVLLLLGLAVGLASGEVPRSKAEEMRIRHPVALVGSPDGSRLFVANRRSGSVSIVDVKSGRVVSEQDVGRGLVDLARLPDNRLLAVDREGDALLVLKVDGDAVEVESRLAVAQDPASLLVSPDGSTCVVASTASRKLSVISLSVDEKGRMTSKVARTIDLPFAPRLMAWAAPGSMVVVADAYGGRISVVDPSRDAPESTRSIPAHNIRGLTVTPDGRGLVVAHQTLNKLARTTFEDVHWGSLLGNHLRVLKLDAVLTPDADLLKGSRIVDIGRSGRAAGDPGAIVFDRQGRMAVALTGVHEVALIADSQSYYSRRVPVGQGPTAVLPSPDGALVFAADSLDDTITIVDTSTGAKLRTIPLGPRPEPGPADRGERLFSDARLSHDGWMSCQSCHTDGRSNGLTVDTLSDGGFGAPKRVNSLLGVGSTPPWTWLGTTDRLEDQVRKSIETTMRGRPPTPAQVDDLTAYLRSLPAPRPSASEAGNEAAGRGREVFRARRCAECHAPPEYTVERSFDVGLPDESGNRKFNPPSLRGVADRPPYLHDGRAATLADVFLRHRHPKESGWSTTEVEDLVAFLKTL
jgi:YVTN family beta-propeller protein